MLASREKIPQHRVHQMRGMRRQQHQNNVVSNAMTNELSRNVTVMSVTNQKSKFTTRFLLSYRLKTFLQPLHALQIASPAFAIT